MSIREIGILLLKLWGLYCLVMGAIVILQLVLYFMPGGAPAERLAWMTSALGAVTNFALGAVLLLSSDQIVELILPQRRDSADAPLVPYSPSEVQTVLFGGLGAFLAIAALRDIAQLAYAIYRQPAWDNTGTFAYLQATRQEEMAGAVAQLAFAIVLLAGRRGLAAMWARIHPMGSSTATEVRRPPLSRRSAAVPSPPRNSRAPR